MKKYKRPPIVERALSVGVTIPEELFERRVEPWKSELKEFFPEVETVTDWQIKVKQKDGMPQFDPSEQKMTLRHRFWKGGAAHRDKGIQVWRDRIAFNLIGNPDNPRHFEEIESFASEWLPRWSDHFGVPQIHGVTLEYVNIISMQSVPKFADHDRVQLGKILPFFGNLPLQGKTILPPYNFELNILMTEAPPLLFRAQLQSVPRNKNHPISLRLEFRATTEQSGRNIGLDQFRNELTLTHELILKEFEAYFSPEAKESFKPYDVDDSRLI